MERIKLAINKLRQRPLLAIITGSLALGLVIAFITLAKPQKVGVNHSKTFKEPVNNKITVPTKDDKEIVVNNVYKNDSYTSEKGTSVFEKNEYYQLTFSPIDNTFDITILTPDFAKGRALAENALVSKLGVSREEACKLNVRITTHPQLNPEEAENEYGLSFCEGN